jgi:hypothetical protein
VNDGSAPLDDECGICDGDNSTCLDCADVPNGDAVLDNCGVCDNDTQNDCEQDCAGVWGGDALEDNCGVCDIDPLNDCTADCAGIDGGSAENDECGVCDGIEGYVAGSCYDCDNVPNGDNLEDECETCDSDSSNDCVQDCNDDWGGLATEKTYYYDTDGDGTGCDGNNTTECDQFTCTSTDCSGDGQEGDCVHNFCSSMIPSSWYLDNSSDCDACTFGYDACGDCGGSGVTAACGCTDTTTIAACIVTKSTSITI